MLLSRDMCFLHLLRNTHDEVFSEKSRIVFR
jgi:hypothetical protein